MAETCTSPSWWTPTSTNAPNAATLVTTPSSTMPGFRSATFSTPAANSAVLNSGRGSRDRSTPVLPISSSTRRPVASRMRRTTG
ncbi:Uncharacterised protein [Mycobacteroides abscessus subsp. abscessus]|nr:Uncharacterised protein [Mycobacteroides abscessus subsp. abscessus]